MSKTDDFNINNIRMKTDDESSIEKVSDFIISDELLKNVKITTLKVEQLL